MEPTGEKPRSIANSLLLVGDEHVKIKYDFHYLDDSDVNDFIKRLLLAEGYKQTLILFSSGFPFPSFEHAEQIRALTDKTIDLIHKRFDQLYISILYKIYILFYLKCK